MKSLLYHSEYMSHTKNIIILRTAPKLSQREIKWFKEMKKDFFPYFSSLINNITKQECINLIKVNPELLEIFI